MPMEADEETHEDDPRVYTLPASFRQDLEFRNAHRGASETNLVHAWRLKGRLDIDVLQRALNLSPLVTRRFAPTSPSLMAIM